MIALFVTAMSIHAVVAVAGVGMVGALPFVATFARRGALAPPRSAALLTVLLRCTQWSLAIVGLTGVVLEAAARGAFHDTTWFRASVVLFLFLGFAHAQARRSLRKGLDAGNDPTATFQRVERWCWAMCALVSGIAWLMVVKPFP